MLDNFFSLLKNLVIFSSYVETKSSFPMPLSKEKEAEYLLKAKNGDSETSSLLVRHNLRLVAHIAKKYNNYPDVDELISVGSIGLIKAINSYSSDKGTQLATYAARCIENEILMTLRLNKKTKNNVSLNEPVGTDRDGNELTLIDLISLEKDSVISDVEQKMQMEKLLQLIKIILDDREYNIIRMRYGLENTVQHTQKEVADRFGISRSYISRIEKRALEKIRAKIKAEDF